MLHPDEEELEFIKKDKKDKKHNKEWYYMYHPPLDADSLYNKLITFITEDDLSLFNYLSMGNTMISLIFKRNENDLTDDDIIDFFEFAKNPKQLESLNITVDKKFFTIKTVEEFCYNT